MFKVKSFSFKVVRMVAIAMIARGDLPRRSLTVSQTAGSETKNIRWFQPPFGNSRFQNPLRKCDEENREACYGLFKFASVHGTDKYFGVLGYLLVFRRRILFIVL